MTGSGLQKLIMKIINTLFAQNAAMGALPMLYAATNSKVKGGDYIGPGGFNEMRGYPTKVQSNNKSHDRAVAERLWKVSANLTGVQYEALHREAG